MTKRYMSILIWGVWLFCMGAGQAIVFTPIKNQFHNKIWHYQTKQSPIVSINISFPRGSLDDPKGQEGLALLASGTMDEGAGDWNSDVFRRLLAQYNIKFSYRASPTHFTLSVMGLAYDLPIMKKIIIKSLTHPRFDTEAIDRIRMQLIAHIDSMKTDPESLVTLIAEQSYFKDTPYQTASFGTKAGLHAIKTDDLKKFRQTLSRQGAFMAIVGNISEGQAKDFAEDILELLPQSPKDAQKRSLNITQSPEAEQLFYPFDVLQAQVILQKSGIARKDPRFMKAYIANHILGSGDLGSILMQEIRKKSGLTYGISSMLDSDSYTNRWLMTYGTDSLKLEKSLHQLLSLLQDSLAKSITQKQLLIAKKYLKNSYLINLQGTDQIAALATGLWQEGLKADYPQKRNALIDDVSLKDIQEIMPLVIKSPYSVIVVGGKSAPAGFKTLTPQEVHW